MFNEGDDLTAPTSIPDEQARMARRCTYFLQTFDAYNSKLKALGFHDAAMNKAILANCVESYFLDIQRLKVFHKMERADRFKIAGYSYKWLCKIKPIQIGDLSNVSPRLQKHGLLINVDFALISALLIAKVDHAKVERKQFSSLLYSGHYRDLDGGVMALHFDALAQAYPRK